MNKILFYFFGDKTELLRRLYYAVRIEKELRTTAIGQALNEWETYYNLNFLKQKYEQRSQ